MIPTVWPLAIDSAGRKIALGRLNIGGAARLLRRRPGKSSSASSPRMPTFSKRLPKSW
jgi:hypothetical protein